jgi:tetratricopeptide (TPR) repeat protein
MTLTRTFTSIWYKAIELLFYPWSYCFQRSSLVLALLCSIATASSQEIHRKDSIEFYRHQLDELTSNRHIIDSNKVAEVCFRIGEYYLADSAFALAEQSFLNGLSYVQETTNAGKAASAWIRLRLGTVYRELDQISVARELVQSVIDEFEEQRTVPSSFKGKAYRESAELYLKSGDSAQAQEVFFKAFRTLLGDTLAFNKGIIDLADRYYLTISPYNNEYDRDIARAVQAYVFTFGPRDAGMRARTHWHLGRTCLEASDYDNALKSFTSFVNLFVPETKTDSIILVRAVRNLAISAFRMEQYDTAATFALRAAELAKSIFGGYSSEAASSQRLVWIMHQYLDDDDAVLREALVLRSIRVRQVPIRLDTLVEETIALSRTLRSLELFYQSDSLIRSQLEEFPIVGASEDSAILRAMLFAEWGACKSAMGQFFIADTLLTSAVEILTRDVVDTSTTISAIYHLARVKERLLQREFALKYFRYVLDISNSSPMSYSDYRDQAIEEILYLEPDEDHATEHASLCRELLTRLDPTEDDSLDYYFFTARLVNSLLYAGDLDLAKRELRSVPRRLTADTSVPTRIRLQILLAERLIAFVEQEYCKADSVLEQESIIHRSNERASATALVFNLSYRALYKSQCADTSAAQTLLLMADSVKCTARDDSAQPNQAIRDRAYGEYYRSIGNLDSAYARLSRAVTLFSSHPKTRYFQLGGALAGYGRVLVELGRYSEAIPHLLRAREISPSAVRSPVAFVPYVYHYAKALVETGDIKAGYDQYLIGLKWQIGKAGDYHRSLERPLKELRAVAATLGKTRELSEIDSYLKRIRSSSTR